MPRLLIALILTVLITPHAEARRRAVRSSPPLLAAVLGTEATATNYGATPSVVQRCVDDQPCLAELVNPGETKVYQQTGQMMRIGPIDAGKVNIESDGLTLPRTAFLRTTKIVPGAYDLNQYSQTILIISDHAGAVGLKSVGSNGTTQEVVTVPYQRGITRVDPSTVFLNIDPSFQFEITDSVGLAIEWRNKTTGKITRIPALRIEDAYTEAYLARVTPNTIIMIKNALLHQQGGVNFWFLPEAGIDSLRFSRGMFIVPYGMISTTNLPAFTGSTGDGSLKLTGAPEGQNLLPFYAWAITDGVAYPLTRFQQAATAHGTGPNTTPYQNLVWTGLDAHTELRLQSMTSLPASGILTLDDNGTPFAAQTVHFPSYGSQRITLDVLAGSHATFSATLQMHDDPSTQYPNHTPRATGAALVTTTNGTTARSPLTIPRAARMVTYDVTATIRVRDNGQAFEQITHPRIGIVQQLLRVNNPDAVLGNRGYTCDNLPDPIINSVAELLANYDKLTPDEQQEFSGDREGFAPFAANRCDATKSQYVVFIGIAISKRTGPQEYVDHFLLPLTNSRVYFNLAETRCLLTGTCGTRAYTLDLATIIQPGYAGSWSTPQALADQFLAWVDGNDTNGELFEGKDPCSYNNTGSPLNLGFLLKPIGGGVPFNLTTSRMERLFTLLRSFLIEYVAAHPESYGGNANGYSLSLDPTWSSQDLTQSVFELRADIAVVTSTGEQLFTTGTTRDERLMRILYNVPEMQDALLGNYVQDNNNPEFQVLQHTIERIRASFSDADYRAVFDESQANLAPFFTDTDSDGYCIDILPNGQDWQYDNTTSSPGNNAQGTLRLQLQLTRTK